MTLTHYNNLSRKQLRKIILQLRIKYNIPFIEFQHIVEKIQGEYDKSYGET